MRKSLKSIHQRALPLVGVSLALLGCSSGLPTDETETSSQTLTVDPSATYTITGVASGKCVQIAGQSLANSARAQLGPYSNSASQQFRFPVYTGSYRHIVNVASGKCLDVQSKSTANGAAVIQYKRPEVSLRPLPPLRPTITGLAPSSLRQAKWRIW